MALTRRVVRYHCCAALLLTLPAALGCGGKRLYPVEGVVQFEDGSPARELSGGTVSLESVADGSNAAGQIQPDGTFRVENPLGKDGAAPGAYRVLVLPPEGADRQRPPIDRRYSRYETSGLELTVKPEANRISVVVKRPPGGKKA